MTNSQINIAASRPLALSGIANTLYFHLVQVDPVFADTIVRSVEKMAEAPRGEDIWLDGHGGRDGVAQRAVSRILYAIAGLPPEDIMVAVTYAESLALMRGAIDAPAALQAYC